MLEYGVDDWIVYPCYEKTYGNGTFDDDYSNLPILKFLAKYMNVGHNAEEVQRLRYTAIYKPITKENAEDHKRGMKLLTEKQKEFMRVKETSKATIKEKNINDLITRKLGVE